MTIGEVIKAYRKENNLSQRAFAKKCEMSNGYISMLENDKNPTTGKEISITIEKLKALADGMEISLSELLDLLDDMPVDISGKENNIKKILKNRRKELNLTLLDVAQKVGVSEGTVSRWESGDIANMKRDKIAALSKILLIPPSIIMGWEEESPSTTKTEDIFTKYPNIFKPQMKKVPLLGKTACGEPIYSPNFDDGFALINSDITADFALEAQGDSMIDAQINDGDVVFFVSQNIVDNGQIAAVFIDEEVTLKRVYYYRDKNKLVLKPENSKYEPMVYIGEELNSIRIIGRAVAHVRKL